MPVSLDSGVGRCSTLIVCNIVYLIPWRVYYLLVTSLCSYNVQCVICSYNVQCITNMRTDEWRP
jgi:hypothetical protein